MDEIDPPDPAVVSALRALRTGELPGLTADRNVALLAELRALKDDPSLPVSDHFLDFLLEYGRLATREANLLFNSLGQNDRQWSRARRNARRKIYRNFLMHALAAGVFDPPKTVTKINSPRSNSYCRLWVWNVISISGALLLIGLPIAAFALLRIHQTIAVTILIGSWLIMVSCLALRFWSIQNRGVRRHRVPSEKRGRAKPRQRYWYDLEAAPEDWETEWNVPEKTGAKVAWVEGEQRAILPGDQVLSWGWRTSGTCGRGGYALERGGKIVAEVICWIS